MGSVMFFSCWVCTQKMIPVYCHLQVIYDSFGDTVNGYYYISLCYKSHKQSIWHFLHHCNFA